MWAEQDPADWYKAFVGAVRRALAASNPDGKDVASIGIDGMSNCPTFLDKDGRVLRRSIVWMDQRCMPQVERLKKVAQDVIFEEALKPIGPICTLPKVLWVKANQPAVWEKTYKVLMPKDYVRLRLIGEWATDLSDASVALLFDVSRREWSEKICDITGMDPGKLPEAIPSTKTAGFLSGRLPRKQGSPRGCP